MTQIITIGKRLIPKEHISFIEPFDTSAQSKFNPTRDYKARIILLNRDSILTEATVETLAETHGFKLLEGDRVAANPGIRFRIETFEPAEDFKPSKPYATRVLWRDLDGNEQSKLLLSEPETVLASLVLSEMKPVERSNGTLHNGTARKRNSRRSRREKSAAALHP